MYGHRENVQMRCMKFFVHDLPVAPRRGNGTFLILLLHSNIAEKSGKRRRKQDESGRTRRVAGAFAGGVGKAVLGGHFPERVDAAYAAGGNDLLREALFAAFRLTLLEAVRAVILGEDPYHEPGQANGLAFSVNPGGEAGRRRCASID